MEKRVQIVKKGADDGNLKHWLSLSPKERLENLEQMRREINHQKYGTQQGFQRVYRVVKRSNLKYLVAGGYAVNLHGYPRYTKDIDCWVEPEERNIKNLLKAISAFGFESLELKKEDFMRPDEIIQLGRAPRRINLLTAIDGITFAESFKRKSEITVEETNINFLGIGDLITAKKKSGRLQDLADAEQLEKIKKENEN